MRGALAQGRSDVVTQARGNSGLLLSAAIMLGIWFSYDFKKYMHRFPFALKCFVGQHARLGEGEIETIERLAAKCQCLLHEVRLLLESLAAIDQTFGFHKVLLYKSNFIHIRSNVGISKLQPPKYQTTKWQTYNQSLKQRG